MTVVYSIAPYNEAIPTNSGMGGLYETADGVAWAVWDPDVFGGLFIIPQLGPTDPAPSGPADLVAPEMSENITDIVALRADPDGFTAFVKDPSVSTDAIVRRWDWSGAHQFDRVTAVANPQNSPSDAYIHQPVVQGASGSAGGSQVFGQFVRAAEVVKPAVGGLPEPADGALPDDMMVAALTPVRMYAV